jgi:hypothetical protein
VPHLRAAVDPRRGAGLIQPRLTALRAGVDPPLALLALLIAAWLVWFPPSPDLAAQVYRVHLFATDGFSLWDNNWYSGHYLPDYSLLFPPLAALVGLQVVGVASVAVSTLVFRRLARAHFGKRAAPATVLFAVGACGDLFIGRLTFALGVTFGMTSVLAIVRGHRKTAALLSLGCAAASPVAALFLALAAAADLITHRALARALTLAGPALGLTLAITLLFPDGGYETFAFTSLLAAAGLSLVLLLVLPARERLLRCGVGLYILALLLSYFVRSPMGSNSVRLGVLLVPAIWAGTIGVDDVRVALARVAGWGPPGRGAVRARRVEGRLGSEEGHLGRGEELLGRVSGRDRPHDRDRSRLAHPGFARLLLAVAGAGLVLWQVNGPLVQSVQASGDPSTKASYYTPVIRYLDSQTHGAPTRIEEVFTRSHWDMVVLGRRFLLARGWDRQLDTEDDALFYEPKLTASAYHAWLLHTGARFVVLSDAPLDFSSRQEATLIRDGLPFLREVFSSRHWHVYAVRGAQPLASGPGRLTAIDDDGFTLHATHSGTFLVRVHYTPYWQISAGQGTVSEAEDGWTRVTAGHAGEVAVDAEL